MQYYSKFVPNLSTVLRPLYERLKAGVEWSCDSSGDVAFNQCKRLLSSETVLTHYDGSKPLILATDASSYGVGAVSCHQMSDGVEKPIAFASRTLSAAERNRNRKRGTRNRLGCEEMPSIHHGAIIHHEGRSSSIGEDVCTKDWHTVYGGSADVTLGVGTSRVPV